MKQTYLFYDLETTGLSCAFDQPLQFAGVRTDLSLNEIERYEIRIKLSKDVIPAPGAIVTHRISIEDMQQGESILEAIQQIHVLLNTPGTISIGYNTLRFDDEFLRMSFYQHLLPPYTHQFANHCRRADVYPMTLLYFLYQKDIITWPTTEKGKPSFKLARLNDENQWTDGPAHDALVDVEATLGLAKAMKQQDAMWEYIIKGFDKQTDIKRLTALPTLLETSKRKYQYGLLVDPRIGIKRYFVAPVLFLGYHQQYKNQAIWLQLDTANLKKTESGNVVATTHIFRKKLGEAGFVLPPKERYTDGLQKKRAKYFRKNLEWLVDQGELLDEIADYYQNWVYPEIVGVDVDAALYLNGFPSNAEVALCAKFHQASPENKVLLLDEMTNPNLRERAIRLIGRYYPESLPEKYQDDFDYYIARINPDTPAQMLLDFHGTPKLTPAAAIEEITLMMQDESLDEEQKGLLEGLETYLIENF